MTIEGKRDALPSATDVFHALRAEALLRTTPENVEDVMEAVQRIFSRAEPSVAADAVQYLQNVAADAVPMLSHDWPKTSMLLKHAVEQINALASPAVSQQARAQIAIALDALTNIMDYVGRDSPCYGMAERARGALARQVASTDPTAWQHDPHKSASAKHVMMAAHSYCPSNLSHPDKMAWIGDFFVKHYAPAAQQAVSQMDGAADCACDSPQWCQHYGKCNRKALGIEPLKASTASASDEILACVKCHTTKRKNWDACPECGGKQFMTHAALFPTSGRAQAPSRDAAPLDERSKFEKWASGGSHVTLSHVFSFTLHPNKSRYFDGTTELCWRAWQEALAQQGEQNGR